MNKVKDFFTTKEIADFITNYWYLLLLVLFLIIVLIFIILMIKKKRKKSNEKIISKALSNKNKVRKNLRHNNITFQIENDTCEINEFSCNINKKTIFGRAEFCDVVFDDRKMSRYHFCIQKQKRYFIITDLNSTNGTYLNGIRLKEPQRLRNKDRIFVGMTIITVAFQG